MNNRKNFNIVTKTLDRETAVKEAGRCLYCNDICNVCVTVCPNRANVSYFNNGIKYDMQKIVSNNGNVEIVEDGVFVVDQKIQVMNIADFCNECGNCWTFCPTNGAPYKDKPRLCLTEESFMSEERAYYIFENKINFKNANKFESLTLENKNYIYETEEVFVKFDISNFMIKDVEVKSDSFEEVKLEHAAQMSVLLSNLKEFYLFN